MTKPLDVIAIGNALVDVLTHAPDDFLTKRKIEKGSMSLIDATQAETLYSGISAGTELTGCLDVAPPRRRRRGERCRCLGGRSAFRVAWRRRTLGATGNTRADSDGQEHGQDTGAAPKMHVLSPVT